MKTLAGRLVLLVTLVIAGLIATNQPASAQPTLVITLTEDPFRCDTIVRPLGSVAGLIPGEAVEFSAPELNGVFSRRTADESGRVAMRWNCSAPKTWAVTVRGLSSGASASFTVTGALAPPPPDAPLGAAFDNRTAMTTAQMAIWKDFSPFTTAGIYIPVSSRFDNRADKVQANLTPDWVSTVFADGWKLIPIYVGLQAPDQCATARFEGLSLDPATARSQGLEAAADAVSSVSRLGIQPGNPIYYDMEAYRSGCAEAVLAFLDAWTEGVHASGYVSGVYGSRASTMWDLSRALGRDGFDAPDAVWISTGNGRPDSFGLEIPTDGQWTNARMHQYRLSVTRTYGGVTLEIDENVTNAPLAGPGVPSVPAVPTSAPVPVTGTVDSDGDGVNEPSPDNCDKVANPDQADMDGDGDGDVCDRDIDGDGVDNVLDFAPTDPTISAIPAPTTEPEPSATPTPELVDSDGDGFAEPEPDNCDRVANPDQSDIDNDGDGDVCDRDIDGDGVDNESDQEPRDPFIGALPTVAPEPTATVAPTIDPTPEATATVAPEAEPAQPATAEPQVIVLPTPVPSPTAPSPTAVPSVEAAAVPIESATIDPDTPPDGTAELATDTMTITFENDSPLLPYAIAALGLFSLFCVGMGVRSFTRNRVTPV